MSGQRLQRLRKEAERAKQAVIRIGNRSSTPL